MSVTTKNWDKPGATIEKDWHIHYRLYDPAYKIDKQFKYGKLVILKGMNRFKTLAIVKVNSTMCAGAYTTQAVRTVLRAFGSEKCPLDGATNLKAECDITKSGAMQARWKCR